MIDKEKLDQIKKASEEEYKRITKVRCPYLNGDVHFNAEGFEHLLYKKWDSPRSKEEQYTRLKLLPLAVKVISQSHTLQEYNESKMFVRVQSNSKWTKELKLVKYYIFMAVLNNVLVKIIVREIEGRNKNFYSIIPKWRTEIKEGQHKRILYTGNLEED
ncbi:MAG: hypothetical protein AAB729_03315 [Patescibacteria group bacterium]